MMPLPPIMAGCLTLGVRALVVMDDSSQEAAPKDVKEEGTGGPDAADQSPGIGSSSSRRKSSMPEAQGVDASSKAYKEQSSPPDRLDIVNVPTISGGISVPAPSRPASHDDDKVEAPTLPTSAAGSALRPSLPKEALTSPHARLQQGTGGETGGGSGSSKKSPWNLRSFFPFSPKAASKSRGPP